MTRLAHYTMTSHGTAVYSDHRSLQFIYNPKRFDPNLPQYKVDKLYRWALRLATFVYSLEIILGEENVWADIHIRRAREPPRLVFDPETTPSVVAAISFLSLIHI